MADGSIKISIEVDGKQVEVASKELDKLEESGLKSGKGIKSAESGMDSLSDSSSQASKSVKGTSDSLDEMGDKTDDTSNKTKKFAVSIGLIAIAASAFAVLKSSLDDAISRFDTLNKFPKVLEALGVSAEDSERAINKLSDGTDGLPTKLDDISASAQELYSSFNDIDKATDTALALNNALLGSGASAEQAKRGTQQYSKALQTDQMYLSTWNTLSETMGVGLIKIAEGFGFAGKSAKNDLYQALQDGTITMDQFNDQLIEVGTGTGVMAKLAKENSLGVATSLGNLKNAAARGIADIMDSFNKLSIAVTGKDIAENIDSLKHVVNASFKVIGSVIEGTTPIVKGFATVIKMAIPVVKALTPLIAGLATAYLSFMMLNKVVALYGVLTGAMKLSTLATVAQTTATIALASAKKLLSGPVGWVSVGLGAVVAGAIAVVKWFKRTSAEAKRLNEDTEELGESSEALSETIKGTSDAYEESQTSLKATSKANEELATKIDELSSKENKSASEKAMLSAYIDQLNESVEGLNLSYEEEAEALNMSSEELQARVDLMAEQESYQEAFERQLEISKEQIEVGLQQDEVNELREEWNQKLEDGSVKSGEHKKAIEELDEQEELLKETNAELGQQYEETEEQITTSIEAITEATENGITNQKIAFEDLSESQQETVENMKATWEDYKDAATDMFDTLSDEAELTVEEMTANLEKNQQVIGDWADGIATLAERGVDEGLLDTLRDAGPESAGHVNALVNASDKELEKLSDAFSSGGDVATDALSKSLDMTESGVLDAVGHLVTDTEKSLKDQVDSADFPGVGEDIVDGVAGGMDKNIDTAKLASRDLAESITETARKKLETNSPSKVFEGIGESVPEGMELGISNGTQKVITTAKNTLKSIVDPYKNVKSTFTAIGKNVTSGLNAGLWAGRPGVMATARSIASSIAATMKRALDINSPSYLMRDDVGKMIPAGIALGIKEDAKTVYRELDNLSDNMIMTARPEQAVGAHRMSYATMGNQAVTNTVERVKKPSNNKETIVVNPSDIVLEGRTVGEVTWEVVHENIERFNNINKAFG